MLLSAGSMKLSQVGLGRSLQSTSVSASHPLMIQRDPPGCTPQSKTWRYFQGADKEQERK